MSASQWVWVCSSADLANGSSRVSSDGIAVFRHQGRLYAVEDRCSCLKLSDARPRYLLVFARLHAQVLPRKGEPLEWGH